ncbi:MAG: ParB/RepB/Spo0J family partition protein [Myxococcales bacterium]|nr:ParB/RepB/Spo0J family partition protein [Myxococcales bacterium]
MNPGKRKALGRGLAALIPQAGATTREETLGASAPASPEAAREGLRLVPIENLHPGRTQPRKTFDDERLDELAASIRAQGIIQPLLARPRPEGGFEIVAGERRWRAAGRAGLHEVPVVVRDLSDTEAAEAALVENLQREDLNPIEEARGLDRLISEFGYTQDALGGRVGKDRSTVANALRLLKLPDKVQAMVVDNRLSMGHARALLGLDSPPAMEQLARQTVARNLSVRAVEALVKKARTGSDRPVVVPPPVAPARQSAAARDLTERLQRSLATRVRVVESGPGTGHLEIFYHSLDELDRILGRILPS